MPKQRLGTKKLAGGESNRGPCQIKLTPFEASPTVLDQALSDVFTYVMMSSERKGTRLKTRKTTLKKPRKTYMMILKFSREKENHPFCVR
jgi:hypothetical protein